MKILSRLKYPFLFIFLFLAVREFIYEPYKIPSVSMMPALLAGDYILVDKSAYGIRIPFTTLWVTEFEGPQRGDVVVFSHPDNKSLDYIKRIVGMPGDLVEVKNAELRLNGEAVEQEMFLIEGADEHDACVAKLSEGANAMLPDDMKPFPYFRKYRDYDLRVEQLPGGHNHVVQLLKKGEPEDDVRLKLPADTYFVMGDNRDKSSDSRVWGFLPRENIKGKATSIWLSVNRDRIPCASPLSEDKGSDSIRWYRWGRRID